MLKNGFLLAVSGILLLLLVDDDDDDVFVVDGDVDDDGTDGGNDDGDVDDVDGDDVDDVDDDGADDDEDADLAAFVDLTRSVMRAPITVVAPVTLYGDGTCLFLLPSRRVVPRERVSTWTSTWGLTTFL